MKLEPTEDSIHLAPSPQSPLALYEGNVGSVPPSPTLLEPFSGSPSPAARKKSHSRRREEGYVPRPRNSFIVFRSWWIAKQRASANGAGDGQQNELSKLAGKAWRLMSEEDKQGFIEVANEEQQRHKIEHPNYQYTPTPRNTPSASRSKAKAPARKAGGASRKRKAADRYSSHHPDPRPSPSRLVSPLLTATRESLAPPRRLAAHRLEQMASEFLPSVSPPTPQIPLALHHSPAAQEVAPEHSPIMEEAEEEDFVPIDEIPTLMLDPQPRTEDVEMVVESKPAEPTFVTMSLLVSTTMASNSGLRSTFFNPYTHIPTLPTSPSRTSRRCSPRDSAVATSWKGLCRLSRTLGTSVSNPLRSILSTCGPGRTTVRNMTLSSTTASMRRQRTRHRFSHDLAPLFRSSTSCFQAQTARCLSTWDLLFFIIPYVVRPGAHADMIPLRYILTNPVRVDYEFATNPPPYHSLKVSISFLPHTLYHIAVNSNCFTLQNSRLS